MATLRPLAAADLAEAQSLLLAACRYDSASAVAAEKLFGAANGEPWRQTIGAFDGNRLIGLVVVSGRWLRLLAVLPSKRKQGVGQALLTAAETAAKTAGEARLRTLDQPGNYLAPGIAEKNAGAITWLEKRDYLRVGENTNLLIDVAANDRVTHDAYQKRLKKVSDEYQVFAATENDLALLCPAITSAFSAGWAFEVTNAVRNPPGAVHVARAQNGEWAAFAAHDGNNRGLGWFGPTGTFPNHREKGLASVLLLACLLDVARAGHEHCTIAWIGPREFYEKATGIVGDTRFVVLEKTLS